MNTDKKRRKGLWCGEEEIEPRIARMGADKIGDSWMRRSKAIHEGH